MDLKANLQIVIKNWRILLVSIVITVGATFVFTMRQTRIYESMSSFVIRPHSSLILQDEFVSTLDTLSRRVEINNTFAEVTNSKLIRDKSAEQLGLTSKQREGLSASGRVLVGTNILELTVQGNDPEVAQAFAEAVSRETVTYVSSLYDVFELGQLDGASLASEPASPDLFFNLMLGFIMGTVLGLVLIFLYEYLRAPGGRQASFEIIDPDTGVYNRAYLDMRLRQEVSRARRNDGELTLALIRINDRGGSSWSASDGEHSMTSVAIIFDPMLRNEDLLARFDDSTFALMMPDTSGVEAQSAVELLRLRLGTVPASSNQYKKAMAFSGAAGVAEFTAADANEESLSSRASAALRDAERGTYGRVILAETPAVEANYQSVAEAQSAQKLGPYDNGTTARTPDAGESTVADEKPAKSKKASKRSLTRAALKMAQQYGIDIDAVEGSGRDGRILKSDIEELIKNEGKLGFTT